MTDSYPSGIYPRRGQDSLYPLTDLDEEYQSVGPGDDPSYEAEAYLHMSQSWEPIDCCVGGTQYFRYNASTFLPQEPQELEDAWHRRVSHATFAPYTVRIAEQAAGLILRKPVQFQPQETGGEVDPYWEDVFAENCDGFGTDINAFARRLAISSLLYGHAGVLCDFSAREPAPNLQAQRESGNAPYFIEVDAKQIIGWRMEGDSPLSPVQQVRISEMVTVPFGEFGERVIRQIRVHERGSYRVYRRSNDEASDTSGWYIYEQGTTSLDVIPLSVTYSQKIAEFTSKPPLLSIANLNISHAQRNADLQHSLHVSAMPIMVLKGFDDADDPVGLSVNNAILLPPEGDCFMVEPASQSFQAQSDYLNKLEEQMSSLGISTLFSQKMGAETAESKRLSRTDSDSLLSIVSKDLEQALQRAIDIAAEFMSLEPPKVVLSRDFNLQELDAQQVSSYMQLWQNNAITQQTLLEMMKQGEILPNIDVEEEVEMTSQEQLDSLMQQTLPSQAQPQDEEDSGDSEVRRMVTERMTRLAAERETEGGDD